MNAQKFSELDQLKAELTIARNERDEWKFKFEHDAAFYYQIEHRHKELVTENERLKAALKEMREHICDGGGDRPCSQMWYQDVIDESLGENEESR